MNVYVLPHKYPRECSHVIPASKMGDGHHLIFLFNSYVHMNILRTGFQIFPGLYIVRAAAVKLLPGRRMRPIQPFTLIGSICIYYF